MWQYIINSLGPAVSGAAVALITYGYFQNRARKAYEEKVKDGIERMSNQMHQAMSLLKNWRLITFKSDEEINQKLMPLIEETDAFFRGESVPCDCG